MLATVTGTYRNGQIVLDEELPTTADNARVIVTLVEAIETQTKPIRQFGRLKDAFAHPYWSSTEFNDPLDDLTDHS